MSPVEEYTDNLLNEDLETQISNAIDPRFLLQLVGWHCLFFNSLMLRLKDRHIASQFTEYESWFDLSWADECFVWRDFAVEYDRRCSWWQRSDGYRSGLLFLACHFQHIASWAHNDHPSLPNITCSCFVEFYETLPWDSEMVIAGWAIVFLVGRCTWLAVTSSCILPCI